MVENEYLVSLVFTLNGHSVVTDIFGSPFWGGQVQDSLDLVI
jgi:hypothetical protein